MNTSKRLAVLLVLFGLGVAQASARGVSPYLPLNLAPDVERQIERVLILAGKPILKRPFAAATVFDALPHACEVDEVLCGQVRRFLSGYMDSIGVPFATVEVAYTQDEAVAIPNRHGMTDDSAWAVSAAAYWQPSDYALVTVGGTAYDGDFSPSGSVVSIGFEYAQLDLGWRSHWLSPMSDSSMLVSTQAPTFPSATLSNYTPISPLGISYEVFLGELSHSSRIAYLDGHTSGKPRLAGLHLSIEPAPGWSLGANRIVQFGGGARGGGSLGDFLDALLRPHDYDNRSDLLSREEEFGNQAAAWTSQFIFPGAVPFAAYLEYAGEDTSYEGNYRLGNAALSMGIRFPQLWRFVDLTYEASEWQNGWYVHGIYEDGLTYEDRILGHWGAEYRLVGDSVGAQSHMLSVGWMPSFGGAFQARYRTIANENYSSVDYERAHILSLRYSRAFAGYSFGAELVGGRDTFGESFGRIAAFAGFGDEWMNGSRLGSPPMFSHASGHARERGAELFVDAGVNITELDVRLGDQPENPKIKQGSDQGLHVGIGARRAVGAHSDLGVRLEAGDVHGEQFLAVRALDYRYRFTDRLAVTAFVGAARYDVATPAYGYYYGAGAQLRNVLPNIDLSVDLRYADKVARDKLLPQDPPSNPRPDIFYDIYGATVSLSYRW